MSVTIEAKNTTDQKRESMPIRQDLPREIKKEDVLDAGGMQVRYDEEKGIFYLFAEAPAESKETKSFKVILRDNWKIQESEFTFLKEQVGQRLESLKGKDDYADGQILKDKLISKIDEIKAEQDVQTADTEKRIEFYRTNTQKLKEIHEQITISDDFARAAHHYVETKKDNKIIKFIIEAKNPSLVEAAEKVEITRYLPNGVNADQIIDTQGFQVKYDPDKGLYFLTSEIDFKPGEEKIFEITLLDVWHIPDARLDELESTDRFTSKLVDTGYENLGAYLALEIKKYVAEIRESQKDIKSPEDKIAIYSQNLKKIELINKDIEELKRLVEAADKAKAKKVTKVVKSVTPDAATTWKIIYATIGLLIFVSFSFYFLWWGQAKSKQNQKLEILTAPEKEK